MGEEAPGLTVDARKRDKKLLGSCDFRTDNRPASMITISKDAVRDGETVVHEAVHQLRHAEGRSENRDPTGRTNTAKRADRRTRAEAREERATEKETRERIGRRPTLVLIDESGDPSNRLGSSKEFVMAASIHEDEVVLNKIVDETPKNTRSQKKQNKPEELKFHSSSDAVREGVLQKLKASGARVYIVHTSKNETKGSAKQTYSRTSAELLRDTLSNQSLKGNPRGAKIVIDDNTYVSDEDFEKQVRNIANAQGVRLSERPTKQRSHTYKPLQAHDFIAGAFGRRYNESDDTYSKIIEDKSHVKTIHRCSKKRRCRCRASRVGKTP